MPQLSLDDARGQVRDLVTGPHLVRALASGRRRGQPAPDGRLEIRPVDLRGGQRLQVVRTTERGPTTANLARDDVAALDALIAEPFATWHLETTRETVNIRVTKRGEALLHRTAPRPSQPSTAHDRPKHWLLDPGDPLFTTTGADAAKRRQVDAFLRQLATVVEPLERTAHEQGRPLGVVDLGCGNGYLTLAAHRWLASRGQVVTTGVDVRDDVLAHVRDTARRAGLDGVRTVHAPVTEAVVEHPVDVVLALHACDTATDDALARAVTWGVPAVLAAPCCHRDVQRQLSHADGAPAGWAGVLGQPILRQRLGDVLTDALRAGVLREHGYRVEVVEFVDSRHTPRNALLRAVRTDRPLTPAQHDEHAALLSQWRVRPALARLLDGG